MFSLIPNLVSVMHYQLVMLCIVGFTSMCVNHINSPFSNAKTKVEHCYTGPLDTELAESMFECAADVSLYLKIA